MADLGVVARWLKIFDTILAIAQRVPSARRNALALKVLARAEALSAMSMRRAWHQTRVSCLKR